VRPGNRLHAFGVPLTYVYVRLLGALVRFDATARLLGALVRFDATARAYSGRS
jgi:hypothetical protein